MNQLLCKTIEEWRKWLKQNHRKVDEVWLVFYKKGAGEQSLVRGTCQHVPENPRRPADVDICRSLSSTYGTASLHLPHS